VKQKTKRVHPFCCRLIVTSAHLYHPVKRAEGLKRRAMTPRTWLAIPLVRLDGVG